MLEGYEICLTITSEHSFILWTCTSKQNNLQWLRTYLLLKERTLLLFAQKVKNIESKVTEKQMGCQTNVELMCPNWTLSQLIEKNKLYPNFLSQLVEEKTISRSFSSNRWLVELQLSEQWVCCLPCSGCIRTGVGSSCPQVPDPWIRRPLERDDSRVSSSHSGRSGVPLWIQSYPWSSMYLLHMLSSLD